MLKYDINNVYQATLHNCEPHFVRCLVPNTHKKPGEVTITPIVTTNIITITIIATTNITIIIIAIIRWSPH